MELRKNLLSFLIGALVVAAWSSSAAQNAAVSLQKPEANVSLQNEVKRAIDKGLRWLEANQNTNGFWSTPDHPAITAVDVVAFGLQPGASRDQTKQPAAVKRGCTFLLSCVQPDGGIYRKDLPSYNTSVSLMALVTSGGEENQAVISKARKFIVGLQAPESADDPFSGGIGYGKGDKHPDLSNTTLALEALVLTKQQAKDRNVPETKDLNWQAAIHFIERCQNLPGHNKEKWASDDPKNKGGFIYAPGRSMAGGETNLVSGRVALRSYGSMSYAGLLSYICADLDHNDPRVTAVMNWLRDNFTLEENPGLGPQGLFYYYHTMAKALTVYGSDSLLTNAGQNVNWREQLALKLINLQRPDGSWLNDNGRWFEKDTCLVTGYALITLGMIHPKL
jgi:squalene-hopene/tetraprenyl-beta-curcumene cyclase